MINIKDNIIKIDTPNTSMVLRKHSKFVEKLYYGTRINDEENYDFLSMDPIQDYHGSMDDETTHLGIFASNGDGNNTESLVHIKNNKNRFIFRFEPYKYQVINNHQIENFPQGRNKIATLKITYKELSSDIFINQYISTYKNLDVLTFQTEVINKSNEVISVHRLFSLGMDFYPNITNVYTLDGRWLQERYLNKTSLNTGKFVIDSKSGHSSNQHNPFTILNIDKEGYFGFNLIYSGNHKTIAEKTMFNTTKYFIGMNDYMTVFELDNDESIASPEATVTFSKSLDGITKQMHNFVTNALIPQNFINKDRPILINNWEATYFNFNQDKILSILDHAKSVGIELFVLDDGWFGKRDTDTSSLGDWFDYEEKTGKLEVLSKIIKEKNMKFGLWFEPEMISKDSDLYRNHPEYTMKIDGLEPIEKRDQYMLDLTNTEVIDYLFERISHFIEKLDLDYIKWDCNRYFSDVMASNDRYQSAYYYHYFKGLYSLIEKLVNKYPDVLFESCSAGGNRFDLGMLYYMPQTWASDNSDAYDRLYIQEGTLYGYPQHTMGSHVTAVPNHQTLNTTSLESRFNVAATGIFGYELDLSKLPNDELNTIKAQVLFYKKYRSLLQHGNYKRINSVFEGDESSWIIINDDKTLAIATIVRKKKVTNSKRPRYRFAGLNDDLVYEVSQRPQANDLIPFKPFKASGRLLKQYGLDLGDFFLSTDKKENSGSINSRMFIIKTYSK